MTFCDLQVHSATASLSKCDFFVQLCSTWQNFNWHSASRGSSAVAEHLVSRARRYASVVFAVIACLFLCLVDEYAVLFINNVGGGHRLLISVTVQLTLTTLVVVEVYW